MEGIEKFRTSAQPSEGEDNLKESTSSIEEKDDLAEDIYSNERATSEGWRTEKSLATLRMQSLLEEKLDGKEYLELAISERIKIIGELLVDINENTDEYGRALDNSLRFVAEELSKELELLYLQKGIEDNEEKIRNLRSSF